MTKIPTWVCKPTTYRQVTVRTHVRLADSQVIRFIWNASKVPHGSQSWHLPVWNYYLAVPIRTSNKPSLDTRSERTGGPNFDFHVSHDYFPTYNLIQRIFRNEIFELESFGKLKIFSRIRKIRDIHVTQFCSSNMANCYIQRPCEINIKHFSWTRQKFLICKISIFQNFFLSNIHNFLKASTFL